MAGDEFKTRFCTKNIILLRVVTKGNNIGKIALYLSQGFEINNKMARIVSYTYYYLILRVAITF